MSVKSVGLPVWLGSVMDMYVDIFEAMNFYLFHQWLECPANQLPFFAATFSGAAPGGCIAVLCISSAFHDDDFLGIFFPI